MCFIPGSGRGAGEQSDGIQGSNARRLPHPHRELVGRIEATDWLIDQIVYQLYGLTEEEIGIVEGR